jgi:hypothetical protein
MPLPAHFDPRRVFAWAARARQALLGLLALAGAVLSPALLSSCGGVGTGGTGTYSAGPITGFGSIFVAGVEFFDTSAIVATDDGEPLSVRDLKLGATVTVAGDALVAGEAGAASANASRVTLGSEIVGPVQMVNATAGGLRVLGQVVRVLTDTVFDPALPQGLRSVTVGQVLQVYALYDAATGSYRATRIEPLPGAPHWRLRGRVRAVDTVARILKVGEATIRYGAASNVPEDLADWAASQRSVRLRLAPGVGPQGEYGALSFAAANEPLADVQEARVGGLVSDLTTTRRFSIGGVPVDATNAIIQGEERLKLGADATARGPVRGGVLQAALVIAPAERQTSASFFNLPLLSVDRASQTLVLQVPSGNVTVWFGRPVPSELTLLPLGSTLDRLYSLPPGAMLRVRAVPANNRLEATIINFE